MPITVRFFAAMKETTGKEEEELPLGSIATVADVWKTVTGTADLPANTLCARNMEYVQLDEPVADGDEIAFFPPVTGGAR